jgi:hypothetical protein
MVLPQIIGPVTKVQGRWVYLFILRYIPLSFLNKGKYLLERERLVKDNAWTLDP